MNNKWALIATCVWVAIIGYMIGSTSYAQAVSAKVMAVLMDGNGQLITSSNGLNVRLSETIAGEDVLNDLMRVEQRYTFVNVVGTTTTVVKSGAGHLHAIVINTAAANGVIRCRDNTSDAGTLILQITQPASLLQTYATLLYDVSFSVGLTCVTATAAQDVTFIYR